MRKNNPKYNEFLKRRQRSLEKERQKKKKRVFFMPNGNVSRKEINKNGVFVSEIPEVFSIISNTTETIRYFNGLIHKTLRAPNVKKIFFQFQDVKYISADALMYLLAILKFAKSNVWEFSGNVPKDPVPRDIFVKSGFLKKITNSRVPVNKSNESCYMCSGKSVSVSDTAAICKFIHRHSAANRAQTGFLYDMLIELEVNTEEHAYKANANPIFDTNWIVSVEDVGTAFRFAFLDVGVGICKTVYKRWHESINIGKTHADYLESAFSGVLLRSETKEHHRGRGLPKIKKYADKHLIENLRVVANKAIYSVDTNGGTCGLVLSDSLAGSVYYWEVPKSKFIREGENVA